MCERSLSSTHMWIFLGVFDCFPSFATLFKIFYLNRWKTWKSFTSNRVIEFRKVNVTPLKARKCKLYCKARDIIRGKYRIMLSLLATGGSHRTNVEEMHAVNDEVSTKCVSVCPFQRIVNKVTCLLSTANFMISSHMLSALYRVHHQHHMPIQHRLFHYIWGILARLNRRSSSKCHKIST